MTLSETVWAGTLDRHLHAETLARLRDRLLDELSVQMNSSDGVGKRAADDAVDAGGDLGQFEVDWQVLPRNQEALTEIEAALVRMAVGTYGFCEDCTRSIPMARLEATPHARYCARCQRRLEATC
jgi:DnaK suppressor protein